MNSNQSIFGALFTAAASYGLGQLSKSVEGKEKRRLGSTVGREFVTQGTQEAQQIIYGEVRTSGFMTYYGTSGAQNEYLWMVITVAGHQCEAINDVWLDDRFISNADINGSTGDVSTTGFTVSGSYYLQIYKHLGAHNQTADANLDAAFPEWTSNHRGAGKAYAILKMTRSDTVWAQGAPQTIRFLVKGKRVYSASLDSTNGGSGSHRYTDATTWAWTDNSADCVRDYMTAGSVYFSTATPLALLGLKIANARIVDSYTITAAAKCDELCALSSKIVLIAASRLVTIAAAGSAYTYTGPATTGGIGASVSDLNAALYSPVARTTIDVSTTAMTDGASVGITSDYASYVSTGGANTAYMDYYAVNDTGTLKVYQNSTLLVSSGAMTGSTVVRIVYGSGTITFYKDGASIYSTALTGSKYIFGNLVLQTAYASFTMTGAASDTEKRYTCNVQLSCSTPHRENMAILCSSMMGHVSRPSGQFRIHAGAYQTPVESIGDDDILGRMTVVTHPNGEDLYNTVGATFYDETRNWQISSAPIRTQSSYQTDDGGRRDKIIDQQATRGSFRVQRNQEIVLQSSRQKRTIEFTKLSHKAARIAKFDTFYLTCAELVYTNQPMRCLDWKLLRNGFISMVAKTEAASIYTDLIATDYIDPAVNALVSSQLETQPAPTSLTATSNPTTISFAVGGTFAAGATIELWEHTSSSPFSSAALIARGEQTTFTIAKNDTTIRYYWVTARFNGQVSANYPASTGTAGQALPALVPTSLTATGIASGIVFAWAASATQPPGTVWELFEYTANTPFSSATKIHETDALSYTLLGDTPAAKYYWVRARTNGTVSTQYPSGNGVSGQALAPVAPNALTLTGFPTYIKAVVGFAATPSAGTIVEIWEYTANTPFSSATKVAEGEQNVVYIAKRDTTTRYYWARTRLSGQTSATYPSGNGTAGAADLNATDDITPGAITEIYDVFDAGPVAVSNIS